MLGPDPRTWFTHPVAVHIACLAAAAIWLFSFKIMAGACRAAAATLGVGQ
ncbi:hypothetical protein [Sphingobium sp. RAC03]|nr:hypothetical protein [Sphingobium sp. RAC03]AOF98226.1 hypothetical protein BSY17_2675 [Sphingobium sp. RAC03]